MVVVAASRAQAGAARDGGQFRRDGRRLSDTSTDAAQLEDHAQCAPPPLPRNVKLLGWASLLNDTASEMVFPLLPLFLARLVGAGTIELGLLEGIAETVASLLKLWSGGRSDRSPSRKSYVVVGYLLATAARPLTALAAAPWHVIAGRTVDRVGKGVRTAPRDAMIADSTPAAQRGRAFGFHRAMDHLGAVLGPIAAYAFLWWRPDDLRTLFVMTAVPGAVVVVLLVFGLRETARHDAGREPFSLTLAPFDRRFRTYLAALAVFTLGNTSDLFLIQRSIDLGISAIWIPLLWGGLHVVKSLGNAVSGRAVDRFGPRAMILAGWMVYAVFYTAFAFVTTLSGMIVALAGYGVFYALTEPAEKTLVANLVPKERSGLAFGWYNFAIAATTLPGNVLFGVLYQHYGAATAFGWGAAMAAAAAVLLAGARLDTRGGQESGAASIRCQPRR
jgi:MFS family permease